MSNIRKLKETTVKDIYSLLVSANEAVTLTQLQKDYQKFLGCHVPFQQAGYSNLEGLLRDSPSHFNLYWRGQELVVKHIPNAGIQHIDRLVKKQKPQKKTPRTDRVSSSKPRYNPGPEPQPPLIPSIIRGQIREMLMDYKNGIIGSNFNTAYSKRFGTPLNYSNLGFSSLLELLKAMPDIVLIDQQPNGIYKVYSVITRKRYSQSGSFGKPASQMSPRDKEGTGKNDSRSLEKDAISQEDNLDHSGVDPDTQENIQRVLAKHRDGLWLTQFQEEYEAEFKRELNLRQLGYTSMIELMSSLAHIVTIQRTNQRDWLLFDVRLKKQADVKQSPDETRIEVDPFNVGPAVDRKTKECILELISSCPYGLLLDDLPHLFKQRTGEKLLPQELCFIDLVNLIMAMSDSIDIDYSTGRAVLHLKSPHQQPTEHQKSSHMPSSRKPSVPYDVIGPGAAYRPQTVPHAYLQKTNNYLEVYVATVISPDKLWVQIIGPNTSEKLEELMNGLQMNYSSLIMNENYSLPEELITPNQVCVAIYPPEGSWHRCQITGIKSDDFVELFYVDYGSTYTVARNSLKFLRLSDFQLPAQAIPARLGNIKPKSGVWTDEARNLILELVTDKPLFALVTEASLSGTLTVSLTDTTGEQDVHITDELIDHGLAELDIGDNEMVSPLSPEQVPSSDDLSEVSRRTVFSEGKGGSVECERYVKGVQLTADYNIHIIRYMGKAYVTTGEVSQLLWPQRNDDILRIRLQQRKLVVERTIIIKDENPLLFYELMKCHVGGTFNKDGTQKEHAAIIQLASICSILDAFEHPSRELRDAISREIATFNPFDSYWMCELDSRELQEMMVYFHEKLNAALGSLHYRRMSLLHAMQQVDAENVDVLVQAQKDVEEKIQLFSQCSEQLHQLHIKNN